LSSLKKLQKLILRGGDAKKLYNLAAQKMPWLKGIDACVHTLNFVPNLKGTFSMESLYSSTALPPEAFLPKLKKLTLGGPFCGMTRTKSLEMLSSYRSLEFLCLTQMPIADIFSVICKVGPRLKELEMSNMKAPLDLQLILTRCPNLVSFVSDHGSEFLNFPFTYGSVVYKSYIIIPRKWKA